MGLNQRFLNYLKMALVRLAMENPPVVVVLEHLRCQF